MDLRAYYQKIKKLEAGITDAAVVIVSRETSEGGRAGVKTEVPRSIAARMLAEEKADLATAEEAAEFHAKAQASQRLAQEMATPGSRTALRKG
jgi:hypothetical protein